MKSIIIFIQCAIASNLSCSIKGDYKELGKGHFITAKGAGWRDILNHDGKHKDVPQDIMEYYTIKNKAPVSI